MLKLTTSISKKIGMPDYGSRGAAVALEVELDARVVEDPAALTGQIHKLFGLARRAVDAELQNGSLDEPAAPNAGGPSRAPHNNRPVDGETIRYATQSQVRAIRAICSRQGVNPQQFANERFQVADLEELTLREASSLIDELKAAPGNGRKGGGQ